MSPSFHGNNGIGFTPGIQRMITSGSDTRLPYKYDARSHSPGYTNGRAAFEPPFKRIASGAEELEKHIALSQSPWANIKIRTTRGMVVLCQSKLCLKFGKHFNEVAIHFMSSFFYVICFALPNLGSVFKFDCPASQVFEMPFKTQIAKKNLKKT